MSGASLVDFRAESESAGPFKSEEQLARAAVTRTRLRYVRNIGGLTLVATIVGAGSWFGWQTLKASRTPLAPPVVASGSALFNSLPAGASVEIDGIARGTTPLKLALAPGAHNVTFSSGGVSRTLPLNVDPGEVVSQYVELAVEPTPVHGRLEIGSDPAGAEVRIDGTARGTAPLVVSDLSAGQHKVTISNGDTTINRTVNVVGGSTGTVVVSMSGALASSGGWLTIDAPFEMEVREGARLIGTTRSDQLMLPVGDHDLDITSTELEFTSRRKVHIAAGKTAAVQVAPPDGKLSINALPWADVSIDGKPAGTTPLGNLSVPIGPHEIVLRHPQLGEKRQTVVVKAETPTRLGVDLNK